MSISWTASSSASGYTLGLDSLSRWKPQRHSSPSDDNQYEPYEPDRRQTELDAIKVYRRIDVRYERVDELLLENGDVLRTPLLPGLEMPLSRIFQD